jgi:hypothetical protein
MRHIKHIAQINNMLYRVFMAGSFWRKWFKFVLLAYLIIVVIGFFAFSNNDIFRLINYNQDSPKSVSFISSIIYNADCLAENTAITNKINGNASSLLRNGLLRIFLFIGINITAIYLTQFFYSAIKNDENFIIKNSIILKLRI